MQTGLNVFLEHMRASPALRKLPQHQVETIARVSLVCNQIASVLPRKRHTLVSLGISCFFAAESCNTRPITRFEIQRVLFPLDTFATQELAASLHGDDFSHVELTEPAFPHLPR